MFSRISFQVTFHDIFQSETMTEESLKEATNREVELAAVIAEVCLT